MNRAYRVAALGLVILATGMVLALFLNPPQEPTSETWRESVDVDYV